MKNIYTRINAIEKDISNRINTIELREHDVKLGLVEDMRKNYDKMISGMNHLEEYLVQIIKITSASGFAKNDLVNEYEQFTKTINEVKKGFDALGLDYEKSKYGPDNNKVIQRYQDLLTSYNKTIAK